MKLRVLLPSQQIRGIDGAGGLGDVPVGLGKEFLSSEAADIRFIMPGFKDISGERDHPGLKERFADKTVVVRDLKVPFGDSIVPMDVHRVTVPGTGIACYLLRCPGFDETDPASDLYVVDSLGRPVKNTAPRAVLFSRAVVEFLREFKEFRADVVHCNDWNTGLVPVYLRTLYLSDPCLGRTAVVYTTHNAGGDAYQGGFPLYGEYRRHRGPESLLALAGLESFPLFQGGATKSLHHNDKFNFTKGACGFADILNTVSKRYRKELLTPAFAAGLDGVLTERRRDFAGIINGIDTAEWNPATDEYFGDSRYSGEDAATARLRKRELRGKLRAWKPRGKDDPAAPVLSPFASLRDDSILLGVVSRIDYQKAPILLGRIQDVGDWRPPVEYELDWRERAGVINPIERLAEENEDVQIVILGNANDTYGARFVTLLHELTKRFPDQVLFYEGFDVPLSHLINGVTEVFLQPSQFEPCGLTQLVAMRYGAVPVVRAVGGLADTVIDESEPSRHASATGFKFLEDNIPLYQMVNLQTAPLAFLAAVGRALHTIRNVPARWHQLVSNGMAGDSSWTVPSRQYLRLYEEAVRRNLENAFFGE